MKHLINKLNDVQLCPNIDHLFKGLIITLIVVYLANINIHILIS